VSPKKNLLVYFGQNLLMPDRTISNTLYRMIAKSGLVSKVTTHVLQEMKHKGIKISMLTGYDYSMARLLDKAGIDIILVGDSASNVMAGFSSTLPITLDHMIYHAELLAGHLWLSICLLERIRETGKKHSHRRSG
jgi:pheromone shutdown protein TraB